MKDKIYHNEFAPLYDYFQSGIKGDVDFYLNYFRNYKGKILEIGAGTGRITIPLLKSGLDIIALDIAPKMLEILKKKVKKENISVKTICADMRGFKLKDKFDAIIITFRTFQHMYTVKDQIRALINVKKHLKPNGILIFDVYNPSLKYIQAGDWQWQRDGTVQPAGAKRKFQVEYRNRYDMSEQMMYQEFRFTFPNGNQKIAPLKMRFFFRFEIEHLLHLVDLEIKNLYGDFKKNKFENTSPEMIWVVTSQN